MIPDFSQRCSDCTVPGSLSVSYPCFSFVDQMYFFNLKLRNHTRLENNHFFKFICQYHKYFFKILQWGNGTDQVEPPIVKDHDPFSMSLWRSVWPLTFILALQNGFKLDFNCLYLLDNYPIISQLKMKDLFEISWCLPLSNIHGPKNRFKVGPGSIQALSSVAEIRLFIVNKVFWLSKLIFQKWWLVDFWAK